MPEVLKRFPHLLESPYNADSKQYPDSKSYNEGWPWIMKRSGGQKGTGSNNTGKKK